MLFGQQENHGHPYDGDGVVHDEGGKEAHDEEDGENLGS
jgi:hypothetical protein